MSKLSNNALPWNFYKQKQKSESPAIERRLDSWYGNFFKPLQIKRLKGQQYLALQKDGHDVAIQLRNKAQVTVEEKIRFGRYYPDILLETVSNTKTKAPGWAIKPFKATYLCYFRTARDSIVLFPGDALRKAIRTHIYNWEALYGTRTAKNIGYDTINVPVPDKVVYDAVDTAMGTAACIKCGTLVGWSDFIIDNQGKFQGCINCKF